MPLTAISLFSGCGGSDWGLRQLGVDVVWANDVWAPACAAYRLNMPEADVVCQNIQEIDRFPEADVLVGCYPCQGFSQGGRRDPNASTNYLFVQYSRVLETVQPRGFIAENVIGMTFGQNRILLNAQKLMFEEAGYKVSYKLVDARDYGLAQERKRVFLVGVRNDIEAEYHFPEQTHGCGSDRPHIAQHEVLQNFLLWPDAEEYDKQALSWYYMSRRRRRNWEEASPCVVASSRAVNLHPVSPVMERIGPDKYRFMWDAPARRYSYKECAGLQGFPYDYKWPDVSLTLKYRMIGNAVPPPLMETIAAPLVDLLE